MSLKFPKVSREEQETFLQAAALYKKGEYEQCYCLISGLAERGVARACYCKALLDVNARVENREGEEGFLKNIQLAMEKKYPLAQGAFALYLFDEGEQGATPAYCMKNKKAEDPRLITVLSTVYEGFFGNDGYPENMKLALKCYAAAEKAFTKEFKAADKGCSEWAENDLYAPKKWWLKRAYAFFNRLLMISYRYRDEYANRENYRTAYNRAVENACEDHLFLFGVNRLNVQILMEDVMGLSDLKAVNASMQALENAYAHLDAETQKVNESEYEEIWENYREYYAKERERLASLNLHATTNFQEAFQGNGVMDWMKGAAKGVERWANTPAPKTKTVYTVDGKRYEADEYGVLTDESGIKSDLRVDDVGRLYDKNTDTRLGYFSTDGIFMPE